jgi:hypothetical protein
MRMRRRAKDDGLVDLVLLLVVMAPRRHCSVGGRRGLSGRKRKRSRGRIGTKRTASLDPPAMTN